MGFDFFRLVITSQIEAVLGQRRHVLEDLIL
jgi:hypothetical protein